MTGMWSAVAVAGGEVPPEALLPAPPPPPTPEPPVARAAPVAPAPSHLGDWYGWQVLIADATGLAMGASLARAQTETRPSAVAWLGMGLYGLGSVASPTLHFLHRRPGAGMASLAARTFIPPLASLMGSLSSCLAAGAFERACTESGMASGFLVGALGATALDAFALSKPTPGDAAAAAGSWYGWQTLAADGVGLGVGLGLLWNASNRGTLTDTTGAGAALVVAAGLYTVGLLGPPIVHLVHGQWLTALGDLGIRLMWPILWVVASVMNNCAATSGLTGCAEASVAPGLLAGVLSVAAFDAMGLAWEPPQAGAPSHEATAAWAPLVQVRSGATVVGVAAAF